MNHNTLIPLESIQIATPCHADWDKMRGDDQMRHCQSCAKNVYNLSAMTRLEAQRLITEKEGSLCVQLHRRADGTVLTSDCTVGISPARRSAHWVKMALGATVAAILSVFGMQSSWASRQNATMGKPTLGAPAPMVMGDASVIRTRGEMMAPTPTPTTKPAKKPVNHNANRATRKSHRKPNSKN
jgi:hypothetical protein